jgi:type I restriction enzyme S subunit
MYTTLGAVARVVGGGTPSTKDPDNFTDKGGHAWLTPADLGGTHRMYVKRGARNLTPKGLATSSAKLLPKGAVLMSSRAPIGYVAVADSDICTNQGFKNFICSEALQPEYAFWWLTFIRPLLEQMGSGSTFAEISGAKAREIPIHLPPLAEQHRIVEKVEEVLAGVNAAKVRLVRVPAVLRRFRNAVLAAACSGTLTEGWRQQQPTLQRPRIPVLTGPASKSRRKGANLSGDQDLLVDEQMPELPEEWTYARVDRLTESGTVITYGIVLPGPEIPRGVPYVRQQDIVNGTVLIDQLRHTSSEIANQHERSRLQAGDVLLCIIRNLRVAIVPEGIDGANLTQGAVRIRARSDVLLGSYLAVYLTSPHAQGWMKRRYFGMDMPRINVEDARAVPVALPSPDEQREIVTRVRNLFDLADAIERRVATSTDRADKLIQVTLAKAFRGELVPTEAELARNETRSYEPASALVERVGACPMHPDVRSSRAERCPKCGMKLVPSHLVHEAAHAEGPHTHVGAHQHDDYQRETASEHAHQPSGIEWEDDMVDVNRMTNPTNMRWKLIDRQTGAEGAAIDWRFRVGEQVKIRLVNEMDSDHPMHHPVHIHGAGRFLVLSRDGVAESNLVWKDTVLVPTGEIVDILLDVTHPGVWMAHCHIAEHHESGMMFSFRVDL